MAAKQNDTQMENKMKAVQTAISQIQKRYGEGAIMRLGENGSLNVEAISTGSIALDAATGIGGFPKGRIIEIYGPESSGKTTLALHAVAEAQKAGGVAAFVDAEHALDPVYAANLGVDIDSLLVSQPDDGEQALEIVEALARSGGVSVIVVDNVHTLVKDAAGYGADENVVRTFDGCTLIVGHIRFRGDMNVVFPVGEIVAGHAKPCCSRTVYPYHMDAFGELLENIAVQTVGCYS